MSKKDEYREWLHSKEWKRIRGGFIRKAGGCCSICGHKSVHNDVHHVTYRKERSDVRDGDCRVLCRACHEAVHKAIDLIGGEYKTLQIKQRWRATLEMIDAHELRPRRYLKKHLKPSKKKKPIPPKKQAGIDREAEAIRTDIRLNLNGGAVLMAGKIFQRLTSALKKEAANILGLSFPLASGWRSRFIDTEIDIGTIEKLFRLKYGQRLSKKGDRASTRPKVTYVKNLKKRNRPHPPKNQTPKLSPKVKAARKAERERKATIKRKIRKEESIREHDAIVKEWGTGRRRYEPLRY